MLIRAITLASGVTGAAAFSQYPEFSQQYVQRLGGAVDELRGVVMQFDADAGALGLTRDAALDEMAAAGGISAARSASMRAIATRYTRLEADLAALRQASPVERATQAWRLTDAELAGQAWDAFKPAIPLSVEGAGFAVAGFLGAAGLTGGFLGLIGYAMRRRPAPLRNKA